MKQLRYLADILTHDQNTLAHSLNVTFLLRAVLDFLPHGYLTPNEERDLLIAAPLHDIGKVTWNRHWHTATKDKLTEQDFDIMNMHPVAGAFILHTQVGLGNHSITELVSSHHEKPDGKGTPFGKVPGRATLVLSACDVYCACREPRPYREQRLTHEQAYQAVQEFAPAEICTAILRAVNYWRVTRKLKPVLHVVGDNRTAIV